MMYDFSFAYGRFTFAIDGISYDFSLDELATQYQKQIKKINDLCETNGIAIVRISSSENLVSHVILADSSQNSIPMDIEKACKDLVAKVSIADLLKIRDDLAKPTLEELMYKKEIELQNAYEASKVMHVIYEKRGINWEIPMNSEWKDLIKESSEILESLQSKYTAGQISVSAVKVIVASPDFTQKMEFTYADKPALDELLLQIRIKSRPVFLDVLMLTLGKIRTVKTEDELNAISFNDLFNKETITL